MNLFNNPNKIAENYGIKIAGGLIGFFLLMRLLNLHHHVELRILPRGPFRWRLLRNEEIQGHT